MADLIDREELIIKIRENCYLLSDFSNSQGYGMFWTGIEQAINEQPPADTERHAHWIFDQRFKGSVDCSNCNFCDSYNDDFGFGTKQDYKEENKFCRNCGYRMDGVIK